MPSLRDLQLGFAAALYSGVDDAARDLLQGEPRAVARALAIYRNNLRAGFRKALALEFPVVERLVGEDCFRTLARDYQDAAPSTSGDLHHVGDGFAAWLACRYAGSRYAYLGAVAALEWAIEVVALAADDPPLSSDDLAAIPEARYDELRFTSLPASRLVDAAFPVLAIWRANQPDRDGTVEIDPAAGPESVLVARVAGRVELWRLDPHAAQLLRLLAGGLALGAAFDHFARTAAADHFASALRDLLRLPVFSRASLPLGPARH